MMNGLILAVAAVLLPAWSQGNLDIHHISTGRGNATYFVFPDGTTLLIDAGEADPKFIESVRPLKPFSPRPDGAPGLRPGGDRGPVRCAHGDVGLFDDAAQRRLGLGRLRHA